MDKELAEIFPESENNARFADKLAKVWLKDGQEQWLLIHTEVQGQNTGDFARRMFVYLCRILDRYGHPVTALAILTDNSKDWSPSEFRYSFMGTELTYRYNLYKLAHTDPKALHASKNLFSIAIETAFEALQRERPDEELLQIKARLVRKLFQQGAAQEKIRRLLGFIKYYTSFEKPELTHNFDRQIESFTKNGESMGIIEAIQEAHRQEGIKIGMEKGMETTHFTIIQNMLARGFDKTTIQDILGVDIALVEKAEKALKKKNEGNYTQIKEDLNLPVGKAGISLIDLHDFQRIASTVRSKPPCQTLYSGACPAK
ncbi:MAG: Rpn family recombination-promoting nuclease/putative transposase [Saprospiraceae bacterium]|nr:Rpn family recombination-promoting nuclease/putative transposase [Saprospiraceae bacterium]